MRYNFFLVYPLSVSSANMFFMRVDGGFVPIMYNAQTGQLILSFFEISPVSHDGYHGLCNCDESHKCGLEIRLNAFPQRHHRRKSTEAVLRLMTSSQAISERGKLPWGRPLFQPQF